jgi:hypothetical protein
MADYQQLEKWILNGKQIGKLFSYDREGEPCWSSVAIQKWKDVIKVYVDEILESQMDSENYLRDEIIEFNTVESAINYISNNTMASPKDLSPCKGQKIFNPEFTSDKEANKKANKDTHKNKGTI